jgi:hypothetical protein
MPGPGIIPVGLKPFLAILYRSNCLETGSRCLGLGNGLTRNKISIRVVCIMQNPRDKAGINK